MEKVLKCVSVDNKDVRKAEWTNKEVSYCLPPYILLSVLRDDKELLLE